MASVFKSKLSILFSSVALGAVSVFAGLQCSSAQPNSDSHRAGAGADSRTRLLTEGEKTLVKAFFGKDIETDNLFQLFIDKEMKEGLLAMTEANLVTFFGPAEIVHSADYSAEQQRPDRLSAFKLSVFMHEMTHVQQFQKKVIWRPLHQPWSLLTTLPDCPASTDTNRLARYGYDLAKIRHFDDLCFEQQGSVVEDYAKRFLHPAAVPIDRNRDGVPDNDRLLQKVVEAKFPGARALRLEMEKTRASMPPATPRL